MESLWRLALILIVLFGCLPFFLGIQESSQVAVLPTSEPTSYLISGADFEGAIFSAALSERDDWLSFEINNDDITYWTPTEGEIYQLEAGIEAYLEENADRFYQEPFVWERLTDYKRQYIGYIQNDQHYIYANFFCNGYSSIEDDRWHEQFVFVLDGGDCFFQVRYDPAEDRYFGLAVNGDA